MGVAAAPRAITQPLGEEEGQLCVLVVTPTELGVARLPHQGDGVPPRVAGRREAALFGRDGRHEAPRSRRRVQVEEGVARKHVLAVAHVPRVAGTMAAVLGVVVAVAVHDDLAAEVPAERAAVV